MINSFKDKKTKSIFEQKKTNAFPESIQSIALRKLILIDNASSIKDLAVPPGNRLERLEGKRNNEWSIRINGQWRICFEYKGKNIFENVSIEDYH